jgi:hypothetical protein
MSDRASFVLNQSVLEAAILAELPRLGKDLEINFTSGRAPKGLVASVELTEAQIRQAMTAHARKLVNPTFTHFSLTFAATRGEDGITTNVIASTSPIGPDDKEAPATSRRGSVTVETEVNEAPAPVAAETPAEAVEAAAGTDSPFADEGDVAVADEAVSNPETTTTTAAAPAAGRNRLFADLKRPDNSASE